jgi:hypothetical protein
MVFAASGKIRWTWGKLLLVLSWAVVAGLAFYWGRCASLSQARAAAPEPAPASPAPPAAVPQPPPPGTSDYATQPVAYIYGSIPITRADLGEYLISRYGADRLELVINHRIIEHACQEKGIQVTAAEVDAALADDLKGLNVNKLDFVRKVLKKYNKTLYEWKEDVIRPRLLLNKLCRERIAVTDEELRQCFEAHYGEKVRCRIIMWPKEEKNHVMQQYAKLRDDPAEFDRAATYQASPSLASANGNLKEPIGRRTLGDTEQSLEVEKAVFALRPGEITPLLDTPEGLVIFKCVARIPPEKDVTLEKEQPKLEQEILEKKTQLAIGRIFNELRKEADPHRLLSGYQTQAEVEREVEKELHLQDKTMQELKGLAPQGN